MRRYEQEAKQSAKSYGKDEKSEIKKQKDANTVAMRRNIEDAIKDKLHRELDYADR